MNVAYIVDAVRTAGGRRNGKLAGWHPVDMGAEIINALLDRTGIDPNVIDDAIFGCVTQSGEQTFAFARNIVLASKLPLHIPGVTIDRQCGSSQQAVQFAAQAILSGMQDVVIAGGVESMSRSPMFSNSSFQAKAGLPADPLSQRIKDRFGVENFSQFSGAEMIAKKYGFNRNELDKYALLSHQRAKHATESGAFKNEIVGLEVNGEIHQIDEGIRFDASLDSISSVKPLIEDGVVTAANASQICDGASGVLVVSERALKEYNLTPKARLVHMSVSAGDPVVMLEEPIFATQKALKKAGIKISDIDLYEVNEAFAPVPLAWLQALNANPEGLNVNGGAIALGHPLGASGTKLMTTLIHALHTHGKRYGLQTMCEGGGMANVTILEAC
ncbi:acetyl-CoA C-acetyltransferase [Acinetobacter nosocomialis]|uniref:acetyl-CoA C-acetyltransferase n=1 Tax=Acinetobacter calcoaceticus/baumannii complex TaxID=909768 RepID=UPI0022914483|nr:MULTISPECIES: acetyl-CoA C-acetyltransferase [Acinetobacter calcoaceticus/baumannii complex]MDO7509507.1 acetyl-CoA C-acetyltransferase [Acinetobacter baumannii]MDO7192457.1 acetyl-CoA C-acetyltransferase [Acinetobacter nosocomialis]MDV7627545.1 acetyl-CoA C-acetyltransferase [Acinetobacter baumannii]MDV7646106.1 acetyl-CoA C-acetyltransferase [Acinetobacter baumannii]MDV7652999.1 acetyl-CoA C-acetyltransferase [Acinetobacter baumannii]